MARAACLLINCSLVADCSGFPMLPFVCSGRFALLPFAWLPPFPPVIAKPFLVPLKLPSQVIPLVRTTHGFASFNLGTNGAFYADGPFFTSVYIPSPASCSQEIPEYLQYSITTPPPQVKSFLLTGFDPSHNESFPPFRRPSSIYGLPNAPFAPCTVANFPQYDICQIPVA